MAGQPLGAGAGAVAAVPFTDAVGPKAKTERDPRGPVHREPFGRKRIQRQRIVAVRRVIAPPVELGHQDIDKPFGQPAGGVAVLRAVAQRRLPLRRNAEPHPGRPGDRAAGFYQRIDIPAPPIVERQRGAGPLAVGRIVGRVKGFVGRRVEIVVHVDAVDCVVFAELGYAVGDVPAHIGAGRVKVQPAAGGLDPVGAGVGKVCLGQRRGRAAGLQAVGVHPGFKLKPPRVGLLDKDGERVKAGVFPLRAGCQVAERVERAWVERIPERPDLGQHDVRAKPRNVIKHGGGFGPERFGRRKVHPLPFQVGDPDRAVGELRGRSRRRGCLRYGAWRWFGRAFGRVFEGVFGAVFGQRPRHKRRRGKHEHKGGQPRQNGHPPPPTAPEIHKNPSPS